MPTQQGKGQRHHFRPVTALQVQRFAHAGQARQLQGHPRLLSQRQRQAGLCLHAQAHSLGGLLQHIEGIGLWQRREVSLDQAQQRVVGQVKPGEMLEHRLTQLDCRVTDRQHLFFDGFTLQLQLFDAPLPQLGIGISLPRFQPAEKGLRARVHGKALQGIAQLHRQPSPFHQQATQVGLVDIRDLQHLLHPHGVHRGRRRPKPPEQQRGALPFQWPLVSQPPATRRATFQHRPERRVTFGMQQAPSAIGGLPYPIQGTIQPPPMALTLGEQAVVEFRQLYRWRSVLVRRQLIAPQPLPTIFGDDRLQGFDKCAAGQMDTDNHRTGGCHAEGHLEHMRQGLMLMAQLPVTHALEGLGQQLPGQVRHQQSPDDRHEQARQVEQYQAGAFELVQALLRSRVVGLGGGHRKETGIGLDSLHVPGGHRRKTVPRFQHPAGFQVRLCILQAGGQGLLTSGAITQGNAPHKCLSIVLVAHRRGQNAVRLIPVGERAQGLRLIVRGVQDHSFQAPRYPEGKRGLVAGLLDQFNGQRAIHPAAKDLQRTDLQLQRCLDHGVFILARDTQQQQVLRIQLLLDGRDLDRHGQFQAPVGGQGFFKVRGQHLRQVLLVGAADIHLAAQADNPVDVFAHHLLGLVGFREGQGGTEEEGLIGLEVLQKLLQGRRAHEVRLIIRDQSCSHIQPCACFAPHQLVQVDLQLQLAVLAQGRLEQLLGKTLQRLQAVGEPCHLPLTRQIGVETQLQPGKLLGLGRLQPGGQALGDEVFGGVKQLGVQGRLRHGRFPGQ
ncbi:hypothetical protein D3C78_500420 [compost metagenome]